MTKDEAIENILRIRQRVQALSKLQNYLSAAAKRTENPDLLRRAAHISGKIADIARVEAETAKLYHAFTLDVPEEVLSGRFR